MVDGVLLLVDAAEGPMPQTKFVLSQGAGARHAARSSCVNKIDRPNAGPTRSSTEIFDLFVDAGRQRRAARLPGALRVRHAKAGRSTTLGDDAQGPRAAVRPRSSRTCRRRHRAKRDAPFAMLATMLDYDNFLGRVAHRPHRARPRQRRADDEVARRATARRSKRGRLTKLLRLPRPEARAGREARGRRHRRHRRPRRNHRLRHDRRPRSGQPLPAPPIDPPTLSITFSINDGPLAGREGNKVTSRVIRDRLLREAEGNVAIKRRPKPPSRDAFEVAGRGELQLGVLIETMRREGFELSISRPRVLYRGNENGETLEPIEEVVIDVDERILPASSSRKCRCARPKSPTCAPRAAARRGSSSTRPSRGLIGYHGEFLTDTRGTGVMNRALPRLGAVERRNRRAAATALLISNDKGKSTAYALWNLEERGTMFIAAGEEVYEGMIIGENSRGEDLDVNPLKGKKLTNVRAGGKDEAMRLTPPRRLTLEQAIA